MERYKYRQVKRYIGTGRSTGREVERYRDAGVKVQVDRC